MTKHTLLQKHTITRFELITWLLFFTLLFTSYALTMPLLENTLLVIGLAIGLFSIFKVFMLSKQYQQHKHKINVWLCRFCVFKVVPLVISVIILF